MFIRNPLIWLCRLPKRRGYGIHSPFAYNFVTQVLYSPGHYYADDTLFPLRDRLLHPRRTAIRRLLFRLANFWQPEEICAPAHLFPYLHAGCSTANLSTDSDLILLTGKRGELDVWLDIDKRRPLWRCVKRDNSTVLTFDLYDVGISFADVNLQRQDYIINW